MGLRSDAMNVHKSDNPFQVAWSWDRLYHERAIALGYALGLSTPTRIISPTIFPLILKTPLLPLDPYSGYLSFFRFSVAPH